MRYVNLRHEQESAARMRRIVAATIIVALIIIADVVTQGAERAPLVGAVASLQATTGRAADALLGSGVLESKLSLSAENRVLREELEHLRASALAASALQAQNAELAKLANLAQVRPGVTAAVSSNESSVGTFYVSAGSREGVAAGDIVRSVDGFVLGTVVSVQQTTSLCRDLFSPGAVIDSLIGSTPISLEGRGGSNARGTAERSAPIAAGDVVTASSVRGYPIAVVGTVETDASDAFQIVYVRAPAAIATTRYVYLERP